MPVSKQNLRLIKEGLSGLSKAELIAKAKRHATLPLQERAEWEVPGVDYWIEREFPLAKLKDELSTLSLPGLRQMAHHLRQRLELVEKEQKRRRKKGHPHIPALWISSAYYYELIRRKLPDEAEWFRAKLDVSRKTLKRWRDNPHRDEL